MLYVPFGSSKPGGTGLGLAIARQAVMAHEASSTPGRGRNHGPNQASGETTGDEGERMNLPRKAHKAFIIEDDAAIADILADLVCSIGHEVVIAATLEDARRVMREERFCYVLLDLQFPPEPGGRPGLGSGDTALAELRALERRRGPGDGHLLPIIIVTTYAAKSPEFGSKMHKRGADDFITKPFGNRHDEILDKIREALGNGGHNDHSACSEIWEARNAEKRSAPPLLPALAVHGARVHMAFDGIRAEQSAAACSWTGRRKIFRTCSSAPSRPLRGGASPRAWQAVRPRRHEARQGRAADLAVDEGPGERLATQVRGHRKQRGGQYRLNPEISLEMDWNAYADHSNDEVREIARKEQARLERLTAASPL